MLHDFLSDHRNEILERTRARVGTRLAPRPTSEELSVGIPLFFDDLVATLRGDLERSGQIDRDATRHGGSRQQKGFTVAQVVQDYGDLCQVVTQLAIELRAPIDTDEFKTLNRCLDDAIAQAVSEFARVRDRSASDDELRRMGFFAHELRNHLQVASLSYEILRSGTVSIGGSTGAVLGRSLEGLRSLVDRTLAQVRLDAGVDHRERLDVAHFLEEIEAAGSILARDRGVSLYVERGGAGVCVEADRQLLGSAVSNLLQNAVKFTPVRGSVRLRSTSTPGHVVIEVEDECGGLRTGQAESIFEPRSQTAADKSGLGLGLSISRQAVESMGGQVHVRNRTGFGCVFWIELPRMRAG